VRLNGQLAAYYALASHNHTGVYEPANGNIQTHISNNNQAHTDYLKNNADDSSSGKITATDFILA
jgi:hypothetical protein